MAEKTAQSKRSSGRANRRGASSNGRAGAQTNGGTRPALKARREINEADREYRRYASRKEEERVGPPDVLLDVPELRVESIHLELDDLVAHVALKAKVLNLVKLNVGVDVTLSRVTLDIKGVEAEVVLKARLDNVTAIVDRLMTTLDRNPALIKGLSQAVSDVGQGAGQAVEKTGDAATDIGKGAQSTLEDVGKSAGAATGDIGEGAGQAVGDVGQGTGQAVGDVSQAVGGLGHAGGQNGGTPGSLRPATLAKEVAKLVAREIGHAASDEARDLGLAATRKVRELGERREQRRADKHRATEAALRVADELGIDLASIEGTGSGGRITVKDVREAQPA
jgi:hypothetical protein